MSTSSIWGEFEPQASQAYPLALLKHLLKQTMGHFAAQGGCLALFDEGKNQMRVVLHLRARSGNGGMKTPGRPTTVHLYNDNAQHSTLGRMRHLPPSSTQPLKEIDYEDVPAHLFLPFAVGTTHMDERSVIGYAWRQNEAYVMKHDYYLEKFYPNEHPPYMDVHPSSYLIVPVRESTLNDEVHGRYRQPRVLGIVVLYLVSPTLKAEFTDRQRKDALHYMERIALYLQNERQRQAQERTSMYLQRLQDISMVFPTSVALTDLVQRVYEFTHSIVDVSAMLLTLYDRDTQKIYDIFGVIDGVQIRSIAESPRIMTPEERPCWWHIAQNEKKRLVFSPVHDKEECDAYRELLYGAWGDQSQCESFLFLPMKMFSRVTGSLCITSKHFNAYQPEEIQVLETMIQIVTVSIENEKLYKRDGERLRESKYREEQLAAMNSSLQSISSTIDLNELLYKLVKMVAVLVKAEMCVFFQMSQDNRELVAKAIYAIPKEVKKEDLDAMIEADEPILPAREYEHNELIEQIRIQFKGTNLESITANNGFFYLTRTDLEELAHQSPEGGAIFLLETEVQQMLMIPVSFNGNLMGLLAVHTPREMRIFHPRAVGTLLAISAQAANAIHTAQLFEQRAEAYAELEHLSRLKDEFLVTASHELRTPLTAVSGYATQLKRQLEKEQLRPEQILRYTTKIVSASQQLTDLVQSMTEAARMGAVDKKLELQITPLNVKSLVEMVVTLIRANVDQECMTDVADDLWMWGDDTRVRQVLSNLLVNATKYSPPQSSVQITAESLSLAEIAQLYPMAQVDHELLIEHGGDEAVVMHISDQGEGVLPEDQERIFEKFVRAPRSLTTPVRGSGLGLYISRRYVEAMNGRLWLDHSVPGEGSTFCFFLPRFPTPPSVPTERNGENEGNDIYP